MNLNFILNYEIRPVMNLVNDRARVCRHECEHAIRWGKYRGSNKEKWQNYTRGEKRKPGSDPIKPRNKRK